MPYSDRSVLEAAGQTDGQANAGDGAPVAVSERQAREYRLRRTLVRIGLLLLAVLLLVNAGRFAHFARFALGYPYDLDYGEGIVWQQMRNIVAGHGYGPIGVFPAIVYHYPPIYHLTVAATAMITGIDQLIAGRLVSLVSLFVSMVLTACLTALCVAPAEGRKVRIAVGVQIGVAALGILPASLLAAGAGLAYGFWLGAFVSIFSTMLGGWSRSSWGVRCCVHGLSASSAMAPHSASTRRWRAMAGGSYV